MKDEHELITLNEKAWMIHSSRNPEVSKETWLWSVYRSEKAMHNEHKLITQDEKAWWQVRLENSEFQGNLTQCFHAKVNRARTRFPKETEETNRETVSRVVFILFFDLLIWKMLGNHFLMRNKDSFAQSSKVWTFEARTSSGISQQLYRWASATSLCSKIGIGGPHNLLWLLTTAPVSIFPGSSIKVSQSEFLNYASFHHCLQFFDNWASISSDESPCLYKSNGVLTWSDSRTLNLYRLSWTSSDGIFDMRGLTYSQCVQTFQDIIGWNLWHTL